METVKENYSEGACELMAMNGQQSNKNFERRWCWDFMILIEK